MSDLLMWSAIVGFVAPPVVALVQQPSWTRPVRAIVTLIFCLILGAGTAYFNGALNGRNWISCVLVVFVAAIAAYGGFWKPTRIATSIETATSPNTPPAPDAVASGGI